MNLRPMAYCIVSVCFAILLISTGCFGDTVDFLEERMHWLERRVAQDIDMLRKEFYAGLRNINVKQVVGNTGITENNTINASVIEEQVKTLVDPIATTIGKITKGFNEEKRVVREALQCLKDNFGDMKGGFEDMLTSLTGIMSKLRHDVTTTSDTHNILPVMKDIANKMSFSKRYADCSDLMRDGHSTSGIYTIYPDTLWRSLHVYCDMDTSGGGWTVFQKRQDGSEDFERLWLDYLYGFGNLGGEFWLGNEFIYQLTSRGPHELRIELEDFDNDVRIVEYGKFSIGPESDLFKLSVEHFTGNVSDDLTAVHNGHQFSTKDKGPASSCANSYKGGFWYNKCHLVNINGRYLKGEHETFADGVNWKSFRGYHYSLKRTEMKFRPR